MPNGKPGDHPYTDIVIHHMEVFGDEIDNLVREVDLLSDSPTVSDKLAKLLWDHHLFWGKLKEPDKVRKDLLAIKAELERGHDLDEPA